MDNLRFVFADEAPLSALCEAFNEGFSDYKYGVQFDVLDKGPALSEGRKAAMENARQQAEELASAAGARLGPVMSINFYNSSPVPLMYDAKAVRAEAGGGGTVPVSAGQMLITVEVNVSYELK